MGDIQDDIENKAEELKDSSADQHLGDAMDDAEPGKESGDGSDQLDSDTHDDLDSKAEEAKDTSAHQRLRNVLDDVNLEPPSS